MSEVTTAGQSAEFNNFFSYSMCCAQTAAPEVKKAKRRKMQKRGYCWNKKHYVMKPSGGWWTGRGALSKKPPVLATTIENWQHKALVGQGVTTALGILRFETCAAKGVPKHTSEAFRNPSQYVPKPSKIEARGFLGSQIAPKRHLRPAK